MRAPLSAAVLAGAAWCAPALAPIVPSAAGALRLPRRLRGCPGEVALTFDDGPDRAGTPVMLEILARYEARATFFCIGEQLERSPSLAREIVAAGHGIAIHGYRHRAQLLLGPRALADDLERALTALSAALGEPGGSLYRPPYGIFSAAGLPIVRRRGLRPVLWSRWGHDWRRRRDPRAIAAELTDGVVGGDILLLHDSDRYSARDSWRRTAAALPLVLDAIEARGLRTRPI